MRETIGKLCKWGGGQKSSLVSFLGPNIIGLCFAYEFCM